MGAPGPRGGLSRELLRRYQRPVYALIYRMVRERETAEDLTQETFVKVFSTLESYRPEFKFKWWILRIANNATVDHLRREQLHTVALQDSPEVTPPGKTAAIAIAARSDSTPVTVDVRALRSALEQAGIG